MHAFILSSKQKQDDKKFTVTLYYIVRSHPFWDTQDFVSKEKIQNNLKAFPAAAEQWCTEPWLYHGRRARAEVPGQSSVPVNFYLSSKTNTSSQ